MNMLADTLVSPTAYMRAYLQQRGWQLPADMRVIPNVMPALGQPREGAAVSSAAGLPARLPDLSPARRVWRLAFFSRMEERKGLKVFVDALNLLDAVSLKQSQVGLLLSEEKVRSWRFL